MEPITLIFLLILSALGLVGGVVKWHNLSKEQQNMVVAEGAKAYNRHRRRKHHHKNKRHRRSKSCNDGNESDFVNQVIILPPEEKKKDKHGCDIL